MPPELEDFDSLAPRAGLDGLARAFTSTKAHATGERNPANTVNSKHRKQKSGQATQLTVNSVNRLCRHSSKPAALPCWQGEAVGLAYDQE